MDFPNGDMYEGSFDCGKPHGTGVYKFADGDTILSGTFEDGRIVRGIRIVSSLKSKYIGDFNQHASPHGNGRLQFANGDVYDGAWKNGSFHGEGTYTFADGSQVICKTWVDDNVTGHTEITTKAGDRFRGQFSQLGQALRGVMWFSNGSFIECTDVNAGGGHRRVAAKHVPATWATFSLPERSSDLWVMSHRDCLGLDFKGSSSSLTSAQHALLSAHQQLQFTLASRPCVWVEAATSPAGRPAAQRGIDVAEDAVRASIELPKPGRVFCLVGQQQLALGETNPVSAARELAQAVKPQLTAADLWVGRGTPAEFRSRLSDVAQPDVLIVGVESGQWSPADEAWGIAEALKFRSAHCIVVHVGGGSVKEFCLSVASVAEKMVN